MELAELEETQENHQKDKSVERQDNKKPGETTLIPWRAKGISFNIIEFAIYIVFIWPHVQLLQLQLFYPVLCILAIVIFFHFHIYADHRLFPYNKIY